MALSPSLKQSPTESPGAARAKDERIAGTVVVVVGASVVVVVSDVEPIPQAESRSAAAGINKIDRKDLGMLEMLGELG